MTSFPPLPPSSLPPPPPPPPPTTTLSTLTSLLSLSTTTLSSFSTLLPPSTTTSTTTSTTLLLCPFNHHHHLPPSSLFSHYLSCPSSPSPLNPTSLLSSLHYPHTLKPQHPISTSPTPHSPQDLIIPLKNPIFDPPFDHLSCPGAVSFNGSNFCVKNPIFDPNFDYLNCPGAVLFNSSDSCVRNPSFESNFFYRDCLGVVSIGSGIQHVKDLVLPRVVSCECADFVGSGFDCGSGGSNGGVGLLGSEVWGIRSEVERWDDFPETYSYCVVRGFWVLGMSGLEDFGIWVVANSPRFGVVVDLAMAGHISLLVGLCLKAVVREAFGVVDGLRNDEGKERGWGGRRFCCPVLRRVMMWLGEQLSILYGEVNGKGFTINMLKHCLSEGSSSRSLFSVNRLEDSKGVGINCEKSASVNICSSAVFVSQVAAGVAALYERQILEGKIRALWDSRQPSKYERVLEHKSICMTAGVERQKRPNYRPLIEHDSLIRQQSQGQDSNKAKTREEILAEQRDYKRRRISYRGKKGMRSTTEIMRYIIEEHMKELHDAKEMERSDKNIEDRKDLESITYAGHDSSTNIHQQSQSSEFSSKLGRGQQQNYGENRQQPGSDRTTTIDRVKREQYTRDPVDQGSRRHKEDHSVSQHRLPSRIERRNDSRSPNRHKRKYTREDISSSPDSHKFDKKYCSRSPDRKLSSRHRHVGDERIQDEKLSSRISYHASEKSYRKSGERHSHREERGDKLEVRDKSRRKTDQRHNSTSESYDRYDSSVEYNKFEDRYDPSKSYGT